MRFSSLPRRARARTWLRTRARFRGLPRSPPGGGQAANERRKTKSRRKSRFSFSFLSIFFFFASRRQPRSTSGTAAVAAGEKGTEPGTDPLPKLPRPPGCRGEPSPLRPPPGTAEAPGARSPTRSRQPPSSRCLPGLRRGFLAFLGSRSRAERGNRPWKRRALKKNRPLPASPSRGTPRAKARGFVPLPSRGAWPGWDNGCGENGFKNAPSQEKITFLALNVRGLV